MVMGCNSSLAMVSILQVCLIISAAAAGPRKMARLVPAMYVFGDSTLDVGNNNYLPGPNVPRANTPLNGVDFPGGARATGRFSNGYHVADFIGTYLSHRSYMSISIQDASLIV
ncbi:hypothetical protein ACQJBY_034465 [Aegilops geniculata]